MKMNQSQLIIRVVTFEESVTSITKAVCRGTLIGGRVFFPLPWLFVVEELLEIVKREGATV